MAKKLDPISLTFGGGINRRRRPFDIDPRECYEGQNFDLDHQFGGLHRRNAFQLLTVVPNRQPIRGWAQLIETDGTVTTLVQAGSVVYSWDGLQTFTQVGTCSASSRLRGGRSQNWTLDDYVIITDLEKATVVKKWNGTAFEDFTHNLSAPLFYAKYCRVFGERAFFANVTSGTATPHVILGSEISAASTLSTGDRPSTSLSEADAFYMPVPDLRPITGMDSAFRVLFWSTDKGQLWAMSGTSAKDFAVTDFYAGSATGGDEAIVNIGNDVLFGLPGRIETLSGTDKFGDVENDDVSLPISPLIENVPEWRLIYNQRYQKAYCFPSNQNTCWVLHKSLMGGEISPWSKWVTDHEIGFMHETVWSMLDPVSGLEETYMGDATGRIYLVEGGAGQDGGGVAEYLPEAVELGTTALAAYWQKTSALTGVTTTGTGVISMWVKAPFGSGDQLAGWSGTGAGAGEWVLDIDSSDRVQMRMFGDTETFTFRTAGTITSNVWQHILVSWNHNLASGARLYNIVLNGTRDTVLVTDTGSAFTMNYGLPSATGLLFSSNAGGNKIWGCVSEVYFAPGQYIEFAADANVTKFWSGSKPVSLGSDGSTPTGTAPACYFKSAAATFPTNSGTGGSFTLTNMVTDCTTSPAGVSFTTSDIATAADITMSRQSIIYRLPDGDVFNITGQLIYRKAYAATVTLSFEYGGVGVYDQDISIVLPAGSGLIVYSGGYYWNNDRYYNVGFTGRLNLQRFGAAGLADFVQVNVSVAGAVNVELHEILLTFEGET